MRGAKHRHSNYIKLTPGLFSLRTGLASTRDKSDTALYCLYWSLCSSFWTTVLPQGQQQGDCFMGHTVLGKRKQAYVFREYFSQPNSKGWSCAEHPARLRVVHCEPADKRLCSPDRCKIFVAQWSMEDSRDSTSLLFWDTAVPDSTLTGSLKCLSEPREDAGVNASQPRQV